MNNIYLLKNGKKAIDVAKNEDVRILLLSHMEVYLRKIPYCSYISTHTISIIFAEIETRWLSHHEEVPGAHSGPWSGKDYSRAPPGKECV